MVFFSPSPLSLSFSLLFSLFSPFLSLSPRLGGAGRAGGGVAVEVLPADLADAVSLAAVEARVADDERPIDLLVNNAGFGTYGPFVEADIDTETQEIAVNVTALVRLTHAAMRAMVPRARGSIVNISSMAALQATPGNATYGATKGSWRCSARPCRASSPAPA